MPYSILPPYRVAQLGEAGRGAAEEGRLGGGEGGGGGQGRGGGAHL